MKTLRRGGEQQRTVFTRLMAMQLMSVLISLLILGVLFGYLVQNYFSGVREWDLLEQGARTLRAVHSSIIDYDWVRVREQFYTLAESSDITLWAMDGYGQVTAGSMLEAEDLSLTLERAEITHVLAGNRIIKKVMGPQYQNLLVVMPVREDLNDLQSPVVGALAMRAPLGDVWGTMTQLVRLILISAAGAGAVVLAGSARDVRSLERGRPTRGPARRGRVAAGGRGELADGAGLGGSQGDCANPVRVQQTLQK